MRWLGGNVDVPEGGGWIKPEDYFGEIKQRDPYYTAETFVDGIPDPRKDPLRAYKYIKKRRRAIFMSHRQRPLLRIWDKDMNFIGRIPLEKSVDWQELMYSAGGGQITITRKNNWLSDFLINDVRAEEDLNVTIDPNPTKRTWERRWGGKVTRAHIKRTSEGIHEVQLEMISNWEHWRHIYFAANPVFAPEIQLPKIFIFPMNIRTATCYTGVLNLMRQYCPLVSIYANLFNPTHWLVPIQDSNSTSLGFNPLDWPVQMEYINPVLDQSRLNYIASRWTNADDATQPQLKDAGCHIRPVTFIHGEDKISPHRELAALVGEQLAMPTRNCVVLRCMNKSTVGGPTGTLVDGWLNLAAATADDMITELIFPVEYNPNNITDPLFRKWLGVAPAFTKVIFRDTEYSGIIEADRIQYKSQARTIITGGKSPGWLNQAQTFAIRFGLSQLQTVIVEGMFHSEGGPPIGAGLENVYQGQLDDVLFAFQKYTDPRRVFDMGALAFLEHMENGSGTAYTVSGEITMRIGVWKTRPHTAAKVSVMNGYPWFVYDDFDLGDIVGFEIVDIVYWDNVSGIKWSYSDTEALKCDLSIGTDEDEEDPFARGLRAIQGIWSVVGMMLGDGGTTF